MNVQESPNFLPMENFGYAMSIPQPRSDYAPSVAPSERSNVGLPNRYRAVTGTNHRQVLPDSAESHGFESGMDEMKNAADAGSVDGSEDEEFWAAKKVERDKRRAI